MHALPKTGFSRLPPVQKSRPRRSPSGRLDPLNAPLGNDRYLRIPAISLHRRVTKFAMFVTTEVALFRAIDRPTDLAPNYAQGSMLRPMLALDR
jgi:hypothetical protein